jgi:Bap31/Bap29 transmembrane region
MMRSLVWTSVFGFLMVEIGLTLVLAIPVPRRWRNRLCLGVSKLELKRHLKLPLALVGFSLSVALLDSMNYLSLLMRMQWEEVETATDRRYHHASHEDRLLLRQLDKEREYRTERNLYMAGFALTLIFVIGRMTDLMQEHAELEAHLENTLRRPHGPPTGGDDQSSSTGTQAGSSSAEIEMKPLNLKKRE